LLALVSSGKHSANACAVSLEKALNGRHVNALHGTAQLGEPEVNGKRGSRMQADRRPKNWDEGQSLAARTFYSCGTHLKVFLSTISMRV
jgi:hypothetical protein